MVSQQLAKHYLQSMGIITWRCRQAVLVSGCWQVNNHVLVLSAYIDGPHTDLQQSLWNSICDVFRYCEQADMSGAEVITIQLGSHSSVGTTVVTTHSLADCIAQPSLKREVWHVIRNQITR